MSGGQIDMFSAIPIDEFSKAVQNYKALSAHYERCKDEDAKYFGPGDHPLDAAARSIMEIPCETPEMLRHKVSFILSNADLIDWLGYENGDGVRALLGSLVCLKAGAA